MKPPDAESSDHESSGVDLMAMPGIPPTTGYPSEGEDLISDDEMTPVGSPVALRPAAEPGPLLPSDLTSDADADDELPPRRKRIRMTSKGFRPRVLSRRRSDVLGEKIGVDGSVMRRFKMFRLPQWLYSVIHLLTTSIVINTGTSEIFLIENYRLLEEYDMFLLGEVELPREFCSPFEQFNNKNGLGL